MVNGEKQKPGASSIQRSMLDEVAGPDPDHPGTTEVTTPRFFYLPFTVYDSRFTIYESQNSRPFVRYLTRRVTRQSNS